jgi:hypothetical protein
MANVPLELSFSYRFPNLTGPQVDGDTTKSTTPLPALFHRYQAVSVPLPATFTIVLAEVLLAGVTSPEEFHWWKAKLVQRLATAEYCPKR